ncbi:AAA family ATPase [Alkalicoccus chagannorensis]|uniref:AAA family ATPase n=1 Tax=Alkalicoccus chagannorensis TaxID=427072 RepID=UPI00041E8B31|nr:AAA family ATPase [Alkalicoccus chagannorensis]
MTIEIDLTQQEYPVFNIDSNQYTKLELKNKNFIFGKNGAGKSTLSKMIYEEYNSEFDIYFFTGFQGITKDNRLNALVLGQENIDAKEELESIEQKVDELEISKDRIVKEIKSLEWNDANYELGLKPNILYSNMENIRKNVEGQEKKIEQYFQDKARELREQMNPQITKTSYNKNNFREDIDNSEVQGNEKIKEYEQLLIENNKKKIETLYEVRDINFNDLIKKVNAVLSHQAKEVETISEIKDDPNRKEFAKQGVSLHKAGDNCSFCGNKVTEKRLERIESFISTSEIEIIQNTIRDMSSHIDDQFINLEYIPKVNKEDFYINYHSTIDEINSDIEDKISEYKRVLEILKNKLIEKNMNLFKPTEYLSLDLPSNFSKISNEVNELILNQNGLIDNIEESQNTARDKLRLHYVALKLSEGNDYKDNWEGYFIEFQKLKDLKESLKYRKKEIEDRKLEFIGIESAPEENTLNYCQQKLVKYKKRQAEVLDKTKSTQKFVDIINSKLESSGKSNLKLTLVKDENNIEHYQVKDGNGTRQVDRISTGEKNIIAFLYFLESISEVDKQSNDNKIIIFDDPVNSNDDTMQYLIITEIQKLYTDKYRDKFNSKKDYFICLTHNVHFYLNIQPQGNFKQVKVINGERREFSKYDKNNFFRIENRVFKHITAQKDDFNTHYEALWFELKELYENDLLNSTLNSMRRIIETYTKFNKINPVEFYQDKEEHKKLFDVNSHSIDDHSMETIGKDKNELMEMFRDLFSHNNAIDHFNTHWY